MQETLLEHNIKVEKNEELNPKNIFDGHHKISCISMLFFSWIFGLLKIGNRMTLDKNNLGKIP